MTKRLKIILPAMAALVAMNGYYFSLKAEAYDSYTESDNCQQFPLLVMELGLDQAIDLEKVRADDTSHLFIKRMANWNGIKKAARDCVDIED